MKHANLLACDYTSTLVACVDDGRLSVYSGDDEQPLWRDECDGNVVGVGATDAEIVTLDDSGALIWWDGESGERSDSLSVSGSVRALAVDADGVAAVLHKAGVQILDPGDDPLDIACKNGRCVAWSEAGDRIAVGAHSGIVTVFDADTGDEIGQTTLPDPVTSIAWNADGDWVATAGSQLYSVSESGEEHEELKSFGERKPSCVACSEDGGLVAVRLSGRGVTVLEYPEMETVGRIVAKDRQVVGLAFGSRAWLCVGLDQGDASKISLKTGAVRHTESHDDEVRTWELDVKIDTDRRRKSRGPSKRGRRPSPSADMRRARLPRSERELDTPSVQTLGLLGSVALATITMWGAAKFYCNDHSPISLKPREVGTVELASTPKDAAIEMVHRLETYQFERALELTEGDSSNQVEAALHKCESEGKKACDAKREKAKEQVLTTAELLTSSSRAAKARVTSTVQGGESRTYEVELKQSGPIWKVVKFDKEG